MDAGFEEVVHTADHVTDLECLRVQKRVDLAETAKRPAAAHCRFECLREIATIELPQLLAETQHLGVICQPRETNPHACLRKLILRIEQRLLDPAQHTQTTRNAPLLENPARRARRQFSGDIADPHRL